MKSDIRSLLIAKIKAATIHLGISLLIFIGIVYVIFFVWYPEPFFTAEGGWNGLWLMAAVDLVLGPTLTLIIFNYSKAKKEIVFDLSMIAIIQISALTWGGLQVYSERPVALVMWEGTFYTVTEDYYNKQSISLKDVASYSDEKPLIIYAETNHSVEQLEEMQRLNEQKIPPYAQVHLYNSIKENFNRMLLHQLSGDLLATHDEQDVTEAKQYVFSAKAKNKDLLVYLDAKANLMKITIRP